MAAVELAENVYWVGVVDWNVRDFHGYETRRGTTYNAYLIIDDKTVLVDTVKYPFKAILTKNIQELTDLEDLDHVIVNHVEMDHSSSLSHIMQQTKNATIISSRRGKDGLTKYYAENEWEFQIVKTGDELELGSRTLQFVEAPMLHWPDSMFTYLREDRILMPNDAFGQHLATSQRFDDEVDQGVLMDEAAKYYANILMPYAPLIVRKIEEVSKLGIEPRIIAPSHGVIWRSDPGKIVSSYLEWSRGKTEKKAVIVYDTMWGSTEKMAYAISEGIVAKGIEVHLFQMRKSDLAEVLKEILDAKAVIVGSPTLNSSMFPTVSAFLNYATGLRPKGKIWATFGSYGWGGGAVRAMNKKLTESRSEVLEPSLRIQYAPSVEELQKCREFGERIAEELTLSKA
jgi:anaerobic nitric oxide reductase flavorubredoxin